MYYFYKIFFGTFVLEDVALAACVAYVGTLKISFFGGFMACFLGISLGDVGLYVIGRLISKINFESRYGQWLWFLKRFAAYKPDAKTEAFLTYSIFLSRFVPGTRIPTYVGAGILKYSFFKFFILTIVSVALWVLFVLLGGSSLYHFFEGNLVLVLLGVFFLLMFAKSTIPQLLNYWSRRAWLHSWRKWTRFEFWPAGLFYLPIVPIYAYRSLKGGSFVLPFYANPQILNAGLMGESKWDFLKYLDPKDSATLKSVLLKVPTVDVNSVESSKAKNIEELKNKIKSEGFSYPFILKPDVGQRGYGVRIIKSELELDDYLSVIQGVAQGANQSLNLVVQTLSVFPHEAGLFYYRKPSESKGTLFSITDKKFPVVVGDGQLRLGDLILKDKRARIIAPTYFERLKDRNLNTSISNSNYGLDEVIEKNEVVQLSECGNHCQGAIFENGQSLGSLTLLNRIDQIAKTVPDFYFGRFDIRYLNAENLKQGKDFEIVEINGAGSEATHIWDKDTKLSEAYKVLWQQWKILFEIGLEIKQEIKSKKRTIKNVHVFKFLKEVLRVILRKDQISVSS